MRKTLALLSLMLASGVGVAQAAVTRSEFEGVLDSAARTFAPLAESADEALSVFGVWNDGWVNADSKRWPPDFIVTVYGGLAREPKMTPDALALAVCHELGHGYGGTPYRDAYNRISVEGQADYWGGSRDCADRLLQAPAFPSIPSAVLPEADEAFIARSCSGAPSSLCARVLRGAQALMSTLARTHGEAEPRVSERDPTVVPDTVLSHPRTYQCRLDTWVAARLQQPRPACWYRDEAQDARP